MTGRLSFLVSTLLAELAAQGLRLTLLWRGTELFGGTSGVAWLLFCEAAIALAVGLAGGALLDRGDARRWTLFSCLHRGAAALLFLFASSRTTFILAVALFAIGDGLYLPARTTLIARATDDEATRVSLNSSVGAAQGLSLVFGPVLFIGGRSLGGDLVVCLGLSGLYLGAALLLLPLGPSPGRTGAGFTENLRQGLTALRGAPSVIGCLAIYGFGMLFASTLFPLLPALTARITPASPDRALTGIVVGLGVGGVAGALLVPKLIARIGAGRIVLGGTVLDGLAFLGLVAVGTAVGAAAVSLVWGAIMLGTMIALISCVQKETDPRYLGQVSALMTPLQGAGTAASYLLVALLSTRLTTAQLVAGASLGLVLTALAVGVTGAGRALLRWDPNLLTARPRARDP